MIKLEKTTIYGWGESIRGMRNPMNSWDKSDSVFGGKYSYGLHENVTASIGENDLDLMTRLAHNGPVHAKYRRMITVYVDITAPLYWWKEFDTYKVGTVCNSCSTMHKIHAKELTLDDFSHEHLTSRSMCVLESVLMEINFWRDVYLNGGAKWGIKTYEPKDKDAWNNMIQLLPSSYNQKRTIQMNYEVLANIYESRRNHKLDEWRELCRWIEELPYSEIITGEK